MNAGQYLQTDTQTNRIAPSIEVAFKTAYQKRHGRDVREFQYLGHGQYKINGIDFEESQVRLMLETLEAEIEQEEEVSIVKRLIRFFGGKKS